MSHTERIIGDPKGITRRDTIKGIATAVGALILASAFGTFAITTFDRAKAYITKRIGGLYAQDAGMTLRVSHKNPEIITLYQDYLSPGQVLPAKTELSHRLLHTVYGNEVPAHIKELQSVTVKEAVEETATVMAELEAKTTGAVDEKAAGEPAATKKGAAK